VKILSASYPTLAFHASMTNSFGKGALISLLRQFSKLHSVSDEWEIPYLHILTVFSMENITFLTSYCVGGMLSTG